MADIVFIVKRDIDRGWAWVVMTTTYLGMLFYCTVIYMAGILYMALLEKFKEGEAKTSLVGAISTGLLCFGAPIGGIINNRFSCRVSIMLGGILATTGLATSAFVPNLDCMIVTGGVFIGLGFSISSSGLICVVGFYFEKWRDTVLSLAFVSAGVAMFVSAPFGLFLINRHGLTGCFIILACLQAQMCVFGMLSKPSSIEKQVYADKQEERQRDAKSKSRSYLDLTLLKNVPFTCFLFSTSAWNFALTVAIMHLPNYLSVIGGSNTEISLLMTSFSVSNVTGRIFGSFTMSKLNQKCLHIHVIVLGLSGALTSLFLFYSNVPGGTYMFAIQLGILTGWPNVMMTSISISFVGVTKLSEAYGLAFVFSGIGCSTGPIVIGYVYDGFGSYVYSFIVAGGVLILGCLCGIASLWQRRHQQKFYNQHEFVVIPEDTESFPKQVNPNIDNKFNFANDRRGTQGYVGDYSHVRLITSDVKITVSDIIPNGMSARSEGGILLTDFEKNDKQCTRK